MSDMSDEGHNPIYGDPYCVLIQHLSDNGLRFKQDPEKRNASLTMQSRSGIMFKCRFRFDASGEVFQVDIGFPVMIQEKFRPVVAEFLTRANWGLVLGNFCFDFADGEITFHASSIMDEGKLTDYVIARLFRSSLSTADRYHHGLMKILYAGESAQDAVDLCELYRFEDVDTEEPSRISETPAEPRPALEAPRRKKSRKTTRKKRQNPPQQDLLALPPPSDTGHQDIQPESDGEGEDRKAA